MDDRRHVASARRLRSYQGCWGRIQSWAGGGTRSIDPVISTPVHAVLGDIADAQAWSTWQPPLRRLLSDQLDLGPLYGRICPVERGNGRVALLVLTEYARSDEADAVEGLLVQRGWFLDSPSRWCVPAPLLLAIVGRKTIDPRSGSNDTTRSALGAAFDNIVEWAVKHGASDIHFNLRMADAESMLRFTLDGRYVASDRFKTLPTATALDMLAVAWMRVRGGQGALFDPHAEQQGRIDMQVGRENVLLRWASLATDAGPAVCLRVLRPHACNGHADLGVLGYLPSQIEALQAARDRDGGAIVLAGTVGSGKSSTLATLLNGIPGTRKLVTLEDPVEYGIAGALQSSICRRLDRDDDQAFTAKLRTVKRSALDDLLIGEVRDRQTGQAFMDIVASGTRVYATTHAGSALLVPERLASDFIGVSRDLLASPGILKLIVYQMLLPRLCTGCATPWLEAATPAELARFEPLGVSLADVRRRSPQGCPQCRGEAQSLWGYAGRTVVAECFDPNADDTILTCIRQGDNVGLARWRSHRPRSAVDNADMHNKDVAQCALYKVFQGELDLADVFGRHDSRALHLHGGKRL